MALTSYPVFEETIVHEAINLGLNTSYGPVDNTASCRGVRFRVEALARSPIDGGSEGQISAVTINGSPVSFPVGARVVYGDGSPAATFSISATTTAGGRVRLTVWARDAKGFYDPSGWPRPPTHPAGT